MRAPFFKLNGAALDNPGTSAAVGYPIGATVGDPGTSAAVVNPIGGLVGDPANVAAVVPDPTGGMVGDPGIVAAGANAAGAPVGNPGTGVAAGKAGSGAAAGKMGSGAIVGKTWAGPFGKMTGATMGKTGVGAFGKLTGGKLVAGGATSKLAGGLLLLLAFPFVSVGLLIAALFARRRGKERKARARAKQAVLKVRRTNMVKLIAGRAVISILTLVTVVLAGTGAWIAYGRFRNYNIEIVAGSPNAEGYVLMQALKTVAARHHPRLKITVLETGGTSESLQRLDRGEAQLAVAQADVPAGPSSTAVAVLFEDNFQLLVHNDSSITTFPTLKGKKMALPRTGGQYQSFLFVASHFGLHENDFTFVGGDDEAAEVAFARGEADAIFFVRALHNSVITQLAKGGNAVFLPIEDASAMHVESPAHTPAVIPKGAYLGNPPVPAADLPTVGTQRLLLARSDVDRDVIFELTQVLMENRQEISAAITDPDTAVRPLVGQIMRPVMRDGIGPSLHPGAMAFYDHNRPSFVGSHADVLIFSLAGLVLVWLWTSELRRSSTQSQKIHADAYNRTILNLMEEAQAVSSGRELAPIQTELMTLLAAAVRDLNLNTLSEQSFQSIHTVWQVAMDVVRDRKSTFELRHGPNTTAHHETAEEVQNSAEEKPERWTFSRFLQSRT